MTRVYLADAPATHLDMLVVDWNLLPTNLVVQALAELRLVCLNAIVVVIISQWDALQQAVLSAGANGFIRKSETPERVAEHLRLAAASVRV